MDMHVPRTSMRPPVFSFSMNSRKARDILVLIFSSSQWRTDFLFASTANVGRSSSRGHGHKKPPPKALTPRWRPDHPALLFRDADTSPNPLNIPWQQVPFYEFKAVTPGKSTLFDTPDKAGRMARGIHQFPNGVREFYGGYTVCSTPKALTDGPSGA